MIFLRPTASASDASKILQRSRGNYQPEHTTKQVAALGNCQAFVPAYVTWDWLIKDEMSLPKTVLPAARLRCSYPVGKELSFAARWALCTTRTAGNFTLTNRRPSASSKWSSRNIETSTTTNHRRNYFFMQNRTSLTKNG